MHTSEILGGKMEEISDKEKVFFDHSNYKETDFMFVNSKFNIFIYKRHSSQK